MFAAQPDSSPWFYTYLMYKPELGFRIGTTNGRKGTKKNALSCRLVGETASRMWLLHSHNTPAGAAESEELLGLQYQIPRIPFRTVGRSLRIDEAGRDNIFKEFGGNGVRLLADYGLPFGFPTLGPAKNSSRTRLTVNLALSTARNRSEISCESEHLADPDLQAVLEAKGFSVTKGRKKSWRIREHIRAAAKAHERAGLLTLSAFERLPRSIDVILAIWLGGARTQSGAKFRAVPLGAIQPGMLVWGEDEKPLLVTKSEHIDSPGPTQLMDIEIEGSANYFANGICVHNSIYSWRAAVPAWFTDYATTNGVGLYTLPINYRSNPEICWLASRVVEGKEWNLIGEIKPASGGEKTAAGMEKALRIRSYPNMAAEAIGAIERIEELVKGDFTKGVIMARLAAPLHIAEIECIRRKIPYEKRAGGGFADAAEVQDLLAYLRVAGGWDSSNKWMKRCIRAPFKYIGRSALQWADGKGSGYYLGTLMGAPMLSGRQIRSLQSLEETLESLERLMRDGASAEKCIRHVLDDTMYMDWLKEKGGATKIDASKLAVIEHLLSLARACANVGDLLTHVDQLTAGLKVGRKEMRKDHGNRLVLSTVHRVKALEWDNVVLVDVSEGRFPWNRGFSADEELRLLYVAISRARHTVQVSHTDQPSSHIVLLESLFQRVTNTGGALEKTEIPQIREGPL